MHFTKENYSKCVIGKSHSPHELKFKILWRTDSGICILVVLQVDLDLMLSVWPGFIVIYWIITVLPNKSKHALHGLHGSLDWFYSHLFLDLVKNCEVVKDFFTFELSRI